MQRPICAAIVGCAALALEPARVDARPMDPALSRLVQSGSCGRDAACLPDHAAYYKLVNQWGAAVAPPSVHEARTTGLAGFAVSFSVALTGIDDGADYWRRGTRGSEELAVDGAVALNTDPDGVLQLYSLEVRKGLGLGIEAAGSVGIMPNTSIVALGGELRVALLEGMRHGSFRYLPDVSLGASLRQATGLGELSLRTLALEGRLSRGLVVPSGFILTPWLGYQWLHIHADSSLVDLTPSVDPLAACGFVGTNVPGMPSTEGDDTANTSSEASVFDGALRCQPGGDASDYANSVTFGEANVARHRVLVGLGYRREMLKIGAELITDLVSPDAAQKSESVERALRCDADGESCRASPRQWTLVMQVGAAF